MISINNNKGIALVTSLLFTMISLGIVMALLTIVSQGTRLSAANKTYKTATEAGYGAVDFLGKDLIPTTFKGDFNTAYKGILITKLNMVLPLEACFNQKVSMSTANWTACTGSPTTFDSTQSPDINFKLKATGDPNGFMVYTKITDTRCGGDTTIGQPCSNSDSSGVDYLDAGGGVTSSTGTVTPQHRPAYFRIEVQSERAVNPNEKSQLSVLYAY